MRKFLKKEACWGWVLVGLVFLVTLAWSFTSTIPGGPDEEMRYDVALWLYQHPGKLPRGDEPVLLDEIWGISYGFYPIISYMVSAVFMWMVSIFHSSEEALLHAARFADVLFLTGAAFFTVQTGKRLFEKEKALLFSCLVLFLPGFLFMGTYVNTDSLALLAASVILYSWVRYLKEGWTWKNCVTLAVGMGICFLSYYNAYGWILWSFFFFCATILCCNQGNMKERFKFLFSRGTVIAGLTFLLAGWWFIRNYFLYDGDILGRKASTLCAEINAQEKFKPSNHETPYKLGWGIEKFLFYQDPGWTHNWMIMVLVSFVGVFGYFHIFMNETVSKLYILFIFAGCTGMVLMVSDFCWWKRRVHVEYPVMNGIKTKVKTVVVSRQWNQKGLFNLAMLAALVTPVILLINYAYYNDNQAQGRYIISAVYPLMYFVVCGYEKLLDCFVKKTAVKKWFYRAAAGIWCLGGVLTYLCLIYPYYK